MKPIVPNNTLRSSLAGLLIANLALAAGCSQSPSADAQSPGAAEPVPVLASPAQSISESVSSTPPVDGATVSPGLAAIVPANLVNANGDRVDRNLLANKLIGLYFSAHWCPPCKQFTPKLVQFRNQHAESFEVVFVSSDRSEKDQMRYMSEYGMKWPAVKFGPEIRELGTKYNVRGIPTLIILSADGEVITEQGRMDVTRDAAQALSAWSLKSGA